MIPMGLVLYKAGQFVGRINVLGWRQEWAGWVGGWLDGWVGGPAGRSSVPTINTQQDGDKIKHFF